MYHENRTVTETVSELACQSCIELFADYGVELTRAIIAPEPSNEPLLSSAIGFVGERVRGSFLLICDPGPLATSCPKGGRDRDWIGELSNQLIGRLKVKLLAYDIDVALTTPIVLRGIRIEPLPKAALAPTVFGGPSGTVVAWIEVEVEDGYALPEVRIAAAGETGDMLLF